MQNQMQAQLQTPPAPPVQVGTQLVVQSKEKDPNIIHEQFRKRGATEFHGTEDVMQADEWLEHTGDVFATVTCSQKQKVLLASSMLRGGAKTWWKSIKDTLLATPGDDIWESFKE